MRSNIERICDLIALIRKQPRTQPEIAALWADESATSTTISNYLKALRDEGLIYIAAYVRFNKRGRLSAVWTWQPEPHMFPDAPANGGAS